MYKKHFSWNYVKYIIPFAPVLKGVNSKVISRRTITLRGRSGRFWAAMGPNRRIIVTFPAN